MMFKASFSDDANRLRRADRGFEMEESGGDGSNRVFQEAQLV